MDLFVRFRKDYFNYLISVILPALISGISIPLLKHLLGATGYGFFSIWFNAILILTAILTGWITQSIILFYPSSDNKQFFSNEAFRLSMRTQIIFFLPVLVVIWYLSQDILFAFLCSMVLLVTAIQFCILPIIQSNFQSRKIIFSEFIRVVTYVGCAILLVKISRFSYLYALFIAVIISYSLSLFYLRVQARKFFTSDLTAGNEKSTTKHLFKKFFKYGAPLSLWFVFACLLSYVDKLFMLRQFGGEIQGNYQAIFDLISKSLILIISPIGTSLFPILTSAYTKGNRIEIRMLLKKLIIYELSGFFLVSICYWLFGADLLFFILKIPHTASSKLMGFIIICGSFLWQIAILVQKRFELKLKSLYMLAMITIAFFVQIIFYLVFKNKNNPLLYPLGFLLSAFVYLFLISASELSSIFKSYKFKSKSLPV